MIIGCIGCRGDDDPVAFSTLGRQKVHGDAVQIRPHGCSWLVACRGANHREKGLLRQLLGSLAELQAPAEESEERIAIAGKQLLQSLARTTLELPHKRFVAEHSSLYICNVSR